MSVRRLAMLLGAAFLLWAAVFAWVAGLGSTDAKPVAAPSPGAALFERHCASCHLLGEMRTAAGTTGDAARRSALERFLERHGGATVDENREILAFLAGEV